MEVLKCHVKDCFKINGEQKIKMPKNGEYVKFKNDDRKVKSPFMQILKSILFKNMLLVVMATN